MYQNEVKRLKYKWHFNELLINAPERRKCNLQFHNFPVEHPLTLMCHICDGTNGHTRFSMHIFLHLHFSPNNENTLSLHIENYFPPDLIWAIPYNLHSIEWLCFVPVNVSSGKTLTGNGGFYVPLSSEITQTGTFIFCCLFPLIYSYNRELKCLSLVDKCQVCFWTV